MTLSAAVLAVRCASSEQSEALPALTMTVEIGPCLEGNTLSGDGRSSSWHVCESNNVTTQERTTVTAVVARETLFEEARAIVAMASNARCETSRDEATRFLEMFFIDTDGTTHIVKACLRTDGTPMPPVSLLHQALVIAMNGGGSALLDQRCGVAESCNYETGSCGDGLANGVEVCDGWSWRSDIEHDCGAYGLGAGLVTCSAACRADFSSCEQRDYCGAQGLRDDGLCLPCAKLAGFSDPDIASGVALARDPVAAQPDPDCDAVCGADGVCADVWVAAVGAYACQSVGLSDPDCTCGNGSLDADVTDASELPLPPADGVQELCDGTEGLVGDCATFGLGAGNVECVDGCVPAFGDCQLSTAALRATASPTSAP